MNYLQMLGVAMELVEADRTGSRQMHLHAISNCLPIFSAVGLSQVCLSLPADYGHARI